jgi:acetylornithine deacetylase/succinyl-diaminopimelate desuccinylase-like protein
MNTLPDWKTSTDETVQNLVRLIKAETTNPPGNELPAILVIKDILEREGISNQDVHILESAPNRINLVTRICGDGSHRPLLLSGHVDVVPAEREKWTRDPFSGEIADGCVWGRGALDMKGFLAMYLQTFLTARRLNLPLKRDLILAAIADEEAGFIHGSKFLVDNHRSLIDAEYGITEGGAMSIHIAGKRLYPIQVAEKSVCWMKITAQGEPGHGSLPHTDNAVAHLSRAIFRLSRIGHLPVHISATYRRMIQAIAGQSSFPINLFVRLLDHRAIANIILKVAPPQAKSLLTAFLTNTVTPTMLKAGTKINVIPSIAEGALDCRLLPGQNPQDVIREITNVIGSGFQLEPIATTEGVEFPTDTPLYRLLVDVTHRMDPGGTIFPMLMPGGTDANQYQRADIKVYGFTPGILPADFPLMKLAHGHDERLPISFIETGLPTLWDVVTNFCVE